MKSGAEARKVFEAFPYRGKLPTHRIIEYEGVVAYDQGTRTVTMASNGERRNVSTFAMLDATNANAPPEISRQLLDHAYALHQNPLEDATTNLFVYLSLWGPKEQVPGPVQLAKRASAELGGPLMKYPELHPQARHSQLRTINCFFLQLT